jgi:hypothetical protein
MKGDAARAAVAVTLDVLRKAGFGVEDASAIASSAPWTGLTLVMSEPGIEAFDETERAELQRQKQVGLAALPPGKYRG